jgi:hypothetical protein
MNKKNSMKQNAFLLALTLFSTSLIKTSQALSIPPPSCVDDPSFSFAGYEHDGNIYESKKCDWITASDSLTTQVRRMYWCNEEGNVAENCPDACGKCLPPPVGGLTPPCGNDPNFSFGSYVYEGDIIETRTCDWITEDPQRAQVRREYWCNNDVLVNEKCPEACNKCPPRVPLPDMCNDKTQPNFVEEWSDSGGAQYNCQWYAQENKYCRLFGHQFEKFGMTANEACCTCGGGWKIVS